MSHGQPERGDQALVSAAFPWAAVLFQQHSLRPYRIMALKSAGRRNLMGTGERGVSPH